MPQFPFSQALTANQRNFNPLTGWQFEYVPWPRAYCRLLLRTTGAAATVQASVFTGSTNIVQRSPVQVGGTAGVTPTPLNTPVLEWVATGGDRLQLLIDELAGATPTVDGIISVDPL